MRRASRARSAGQPKRVRVDFARMRQALLDRGLRDEIAVDREHVREVEARRKELEHCGPPQAAPACKVEIRYIYQVLRGYAPEQVFAQTLLGFETVQQSIDGHDDGFVGLNFVMPEDGFVSMRDYTLHMKMVEYLHGLYPKVHISPACRRTGARPGAARGSALSCPAGRRTRSR